LIAFTACISTFFKQLFADILILIAVSAHLFMISSVYLIAPSLLGRVQMGIGLGQQLLRTGIGTGHNGGHPNADGHMRGHL
jgi:hypothetical protein